MMASLMGASTATAASHRETDQRGDAAPRMDILRVVYRNAPNTVSARVVLDDLQRRGKFILIIAPPTAGDVAYLAILKIAPDGRLERRFRFSTVGGGNPVPCNIQGSWNARQDYLTVSVPQKCVELFGGRRLYIGSTFQADHGPFVRRLPRG